MWGSVLNKPESIIDQVQTGAQTSDPMITLLTQKLIKQPHSQLPKPEAHLRVNNTCTPPNLSPKMERLISAPDNFDMPTTRKFIREKDNSFFVAITKRLSSLREGRNNDEDEEAIVKPTSNVMDSIL
ncbi:uncharacterized protein Fot_19240 [Forsythia ovata]|uniref:Uncharacterized protein n=1 Tax=Forsythia ovata TaxID=205694 RepID=A0ABD1VKH4_9LAMI